MVGAVALAAGLLSAAAPPAAPADPAGPAASPGISVPVSRVLPKAIAVADGTKTPFHATKLSWPGAQTADVALHQGTRARAGSSSPAWIEPLSGTRGEAYQGPATARMAVLPQSAAQAAGVSGVLLAVSPTASGTGAVRVGLDYASFAQQYGGDYGARLTLVQLPACALTTPSLAQCRTQKPVGAANDAKAQAVSASVSLSGAAAAPTVLAATSTTGSDGGAGGSYGSTSLKPSSSWNEGGDSGSFDYSYPVQLPASSSKLVPSVGLSYSSQGLDGQTAVASAQSSWVGDGWNTPDSFVEQTFDACSDSPEGTALPSSEATGDECYDGPILTLSLNGSSTALVCNADESSCTPETDNGETVSHVVSSASNGSGVYEGTDYWLITQRDGTKYYFGRNQLPGYASGKAPTNSVDTEPVYSANSGDPCYNSAGFASSVCTMPYRWHLDYATNVTGQAMAYYYSQATNYYGEDNGAQNVSYVRSSTLAEIDYGFQDGDAYGTSAPVPDKVVFTPNANGRCVLSSCTALTSSSMTATLAGTQYPDVPYDLICASGTSCTSHSPSFFSTDRLATIATSQYNGSTWAPIDSYALVQTEPQTGDTTNSTLWLASVQRTGKDTSAAAAGAQPVTEPAVTFGGTDLPNRVDTVSFPGLYRYRLSSVTTELGAVTSITYGTPNPCSVTYVRAQTAASAANNTNSCYPVYWTPPGYTTQLMDWMQSYAVTQVVVKDATGGSLNQETDYRYGGGAAWHYDDNEVVKPKYRTYGQFRGYATVTTLNGQAANDPQTEQIDTYYRGMDGDWLSSGSTRSVTLTDSAGGKHADSAALAGNRLESQSYNGSGGPLMNDSVTSYWVSGAVETRTRSGLPDLAAQAVGPEEVWKSQAVTDGGKVGTPTVTETDTSYDTGTGDADFALPQFTYTHTVPAAAAYDTCARTQYAAANTGENLVGLVASQETDSVACSGFTENSATPSSPNGTITLAAPTAAAVAAPLHVVSATQTFYDDPTFSTTPQTSAPTKGLVTMTRKASDYSNGAFAFQTQTRQTFDSYGRVNASYDDYGAATTTAYNVNTAGLTTGTTVTAPSTGGVAHVTVTTQDPARGQNVSATDQNGIVTTEQYDALGRLTAVWNASGYAAGLPANIIYTYTVSNSGDSGVATQTLNDEGAYNTSYTIDDSLGRVRQTQSPTPKGGRLITDSVFDSRGWVSKTNTSYWDSTTAPALSLVTVADANSLNQDEFIYDGLGRKVQDVSRQNATTKGVTTTIYNGDSTTVVPPAGGTVKTTQVDPLGRTTKIVEYNTTAPSVSVPANTFTGLFGISGGTPVTTSYTYDGHGNQATTTDNANDTWTSTYNLLGQAVQTQDPDLGTVQNTYDLDGRLWQTQDAMNQYVSYTYDADGRKTGEYSDKTSNQVAYQSPTSYGTQLASWTYDNANKVSGVQLAIGQATTTTSYDPVSHLAYTQQALGFNRFGESAGSTVTIPSTTANGNLGTSWTVRKYYTAETGLPSSTAYPQGGGLPAETVSQTYTTSFDLPNGVGTSLATADPAIGYDQGTTYNDLSQVANTIIGNATNYSSITDQYDPHTTTLTDQLVSRDSAGTHAVDDVSYQHDAAGLTTSETDTRLGNTSAAETQCYAYTPQSQLAAAWTATDACAATPTASAHGTVGDPLGTSSTYWQTFAYTATDDRDVQTAYQAATGLTASTKAGYNGDAATGPSQPTTLTSSVTTGAISASTSYGYNPDGQQITRNTALGNQTLAWDVTGKLSGVTTKSGSTTTASSYVYDASGGLLLQTTGNQVTLYMAGQQLSANTGTNVVTGTRYYPLPGGATAVRTGSDTAFRFELGSDQHGTNTLSLDATAQNPTWRQFDPYGNARGASVSWTDNRGFLDKVADASTGLTEVGARWYDPATGTFISADPLLENTDPTQLGGYGYAGGDPVSASDPSGQSSTGGTDSNPGSCGWGPGGEQLPCPTSGSPSNPGSCGWGPGGEQLPCPGQSTGGGGGSGSCGGLDIPGGCGSGVTDGTYIGPGPATIPTDSTWINPFTISMEFSSGQCAPSVGYLAAPCSMAGAVTTMGGTVTSYAQLFQADNYVAALKSGNPAQAMAKANTMLDLLNSEGRLPGWVAEHADLLKSTGNTLGFVGFVGGWMYNYGNDQSTYGMSKGRAAATGLVQSAADTGISLVTVGEFAAAGCEIGLAVGCGVGTVVGGVVAFAESNVANNLIADVSNWLSSGSSGPTSYQKNGCEMVHGTCA